LTGLAGVTHINPSAEVSAPYAVVVSPGGTVTPAGKQLGFTFNNVRNGSFETLSYSVDLTPAAMGELLLTGDGSDFVGGASPTVVTWDTPFASGERGAPCMIQVTSAPAPCTVTAAATGPARACRNEVFTLDGSAVAVSCPGGTLEYRWTGPGLPANPPFDPSPTLPASSSTPGINDYTLEARCVADPTCTGTDTVSVDVSTSDAAVADAGLDRTIAACDLPIAIGTPGDPVNFTYSWTPTNLVSDATVPEPDFIEPALGVYDLTLTVTSIADPLCTAQDPVRITVVDGTPVGTIGNNLSAVRASRDVSLTWPLGLIVPDRYNLHRTTLKTDLDLLNYLAPILNPGPITAGSYVDALALDAPEPLFHYQVYGRDCAGASVIP
jgi:hypothetical protein